MVNLILAEAFTFDTEVQGQLRDLIGTGVKQHLITTLQVSLRKQNRMAEQWKQAGGVQVGDNGLWDKLVKNEKDIRDILAQTGTKIPITVTQWMESFFLDPDTRTYPNFLARSTEVPDRPESASTVPPAPSSQLRSHIERSYSSISGDRPAGVDIIRSDRDLARSSSTPTLNTLSPPKSEGEKRSGETEESDSLRSDVTARLEEIRARLITAFKDVGEYRRLLSCQGAEAQSLLDMFQLILRTSRSENYIRADFIVATRRLSSKTNYYPAPFYLTDVHLLTQRPVVSGGYADIHKGMFQGKHVCVKIIRVYERSIYEHTIKIIAREAVIWGQLSHPNLLPLYGLYQVGEQLSLVCPWAENGTVLEFLKQNPTADHILLCSDVAGGIAYLHDNDIIHGDLKGANVLVDRSCRAYLTDFGLSAVEDAEILHWTSQSASASTGGTVRWQAPELFEPEPESSGYNSSASGSSGPSNTKATDVYAWSCTGYEIFTMCLPFYEYRHDFLVMNKVAAGARPTRPAAGEDQRGLTDHIWKLMNDCWERNPAHRPSITEVLSRLAAVQQDDCRPPGEWNSGLAAQNEGLGDAVMSLTLEGLNAMLSREPQA